VFSNSALHTLKKKKMKKILLAVFVLFGFALNVLADELYDGMSLDLAQSTQNGSSNSSFGFTGILSKRLSEFYGYELQTGLFGDSGPFNGNALVDTSAVGLLPMGSNGLKLYGKVGLADVFSWNSKTNLDANNLGVTYGAGLEFQKNKAAFRAGFQHYNVGDDKLSPSLSTNLIGISVLLRE
jgi:hypothetical protein